MIKEGPGTTTSSGALERFARFLKKGLLVHGMCYEMTILTGGTSLQMPLKF